ncbi:endonuclease [Vibrio agarivorans]|uniref:Endonuclease n=1 Tax=Vibrio agarivorans TaxID=153622 RepID=A0ABT7Y776_9VIBR|nr:endonuclease [Vibrio agarivorans]MDN2483911.1 endonuclease [Vibrio agarivorans]
MIRRTIILITAALTVMTAQADSEGPRNFRHAKVLAKNHVFFDREQSELGTLYCGCDWKFRGESGGVVDKASCGYETRKNEVRASRIEYEHIMPISNIGRSLQCWQNGGRKNCQAKDPVFNKIEANLHNLDIAIGEVNADRSNYLFGQFTKQKATQYGQCDVHVDFKNRQAQPREEVRGIIARTYLLMHDLYDIRPSNQQLRLLETWHATYPVSEWEAERDRRIASIMGYNNPYVLDPSLRYKDRPAQDIKVVSGQETLTDVAGFQSVKGNKRSKIYHLSVGCPSFSSVSEHNAVSFDTEEEAIEAGFKKAGNCI